VILIGTNSAGLFVAMSLYDHLSVGLRFEHRAQLRQQTPPDGEDGTRPVRASHARAGWWGWSGAGL